MAAADNLVSWFADHVCVLHGGRMVEDGPVEQLFRHPRQAYTRELLAAAPALRPHRPAASRPAPPRHPARPATEAPLLELSAVSQTYAGRPAVVDVDLAVRPGEFLAVVGESGSGKSTLGRLMLALERPAKGVVRFAGTSLGTLAPSALRRLRAEFQPVFQDPLSSLDPRWSARRSILQPLDVHGLRGWPDRESAAAALLDRVGLSGLGERRPHELSGGQRQRVAIARALAPRPRLVVADEAVSALDVTTQIRIIALLTRFCREEGGAVVFITHDLRLVQAQADRVAVLHRGRLVETGPPEQVIGAPVQPYTQSLVAALLPPRFSRGVET
jgi:peptide/nickel transport system ATP-binding protein